MCSLPAPPLPKVLGPNTLLSPQNRMGHQSGLSEPLTRQKVFSSGTKEQGFAPDSSAFMLGKTGCDPDRLAPATGCYLLLDCLSKCVFLTTGFSLIFHLWEVNGST